jgi:type I restriction enzyme S subunit
MARYEVVVPPVSIASGFMDQVRPLVERIVTGIHESRTLAQLRDTLLPKLISGELRVSEVEETMAEAMTQ